MLSGQVHAPLNLSRRRRAQRVHRNLHPTIFEDSAGHRLVGASSRDVEKYHVIRVIEPLSIETPLGYFGGDALMKNDGSMASRLVPCFFGSSD